MVATVRRAASRSARRQPEALVGDQEWQAASRSKRADRAPQGSAATSRFGVAAFGTVRYQAVGDDPITVNVVIVFPAPSPPSSPSPVNVPEKVLVGCPLTRTVTT